MGDWIPCFLACLIEESLLISFCISQFLNGFGVPILWKYSSGHSGVIHYYFFLNCSSSLKKQFVNLCFLIPPLFTPELFCVTILLLLWLCECVTHSFAFMTATKNVPMVTLKVTFPVLCLLGFCGTRHYWFFPSQRQPSGFSSISQIPFPSHFPLIVLCSLSYHSM